MEIYIIEHGHFCQHGEVVAAFTKEADAIDALLEIEAAEEKKPDTVVTWGIQEETTTPGVLCGLWSGSSRGNACAQGWRLRKIEAK